MSGLVVAGVTVTYGKTLALDDASLTVERGEIVSIVGASGSGKSTLLSAIAGIVAYDGLISWDGEDLALLPVHRRGVGLVFQDGQLFPHRDVARNVAFGLEVAGVERPQRERRVEELLELVGLADLAHRAPDELSGGERQRVALARSLAPSPRILLLDEPLSSLDADLRGRLAVEVRDILMASGTTAIVVTHDVDEAHTMGSRVVRMVNGRLGSI